MTLFVNGERPAGAGFEFVRGRVVAKILPHMLSEANAVENETSGIVTATLLVCVAGVVVDAGAG